jgi:hypothetical protein
VNSGKGEQALEVSIKIKRGVKKVETAVWKNGEQWCEKG